MSVPVGWGCVGGGGGGGGALLNDNKNDCLADYVSIHDIPCHQWQLIGNRVGFSSEESDLRDWRINI